MKILFTGGGTGGHFYPIIAVAEAVHDIVREQKLIAPELYYAAPNSYDLDMLTANEIKFVPVAAGKMRAYFSLLNITDTIKTAWGIIRSITHIFFLYPDVVFGKGGYASFPTLLAARIFRIPVVIHESDSIPGRVNLWAGKFAVKVAVSFAEAAIYFPPNTVAHTGNPTRKSMMHTLTEGSLEYLHLEPNVPVILVMGGSQGATSINDTLISALPKLVENYQIIHQTGRANLTEVAGRAGIILDDNPLSSRYHPMGYLDDLTLRMAAGAATLVISRAGSTIFEIAAWGKPSILIPLPPEVDPTGHATKNAFVYASTGAATVIEQNNLSSHMLISEIKRIAGNQVLYEKMSVAAKKFSQGDAARTIAKALIDICISHEK